MAVKITQSSHLILQTDLSRKSKPFHWKLPWSGWAWNPIWVVLIQTHTHTHSPSKPWEVHTELSWNPLHPAIRLKKNKIKNDRGGLWGCDQRYFKFPLPPPDLVSFSEPSLRPSDNAESHRCKNLALVLMKPCWGLCLRGNDGSRRCSVMFAFTSASAQELTFFELLTTGLFLSPPSLACHSLASCGLCFFYTQIQNVHFFSLSPASSWAHLALVGAMIPSEMQK